MTTSQLHEFAWLGAEARLRAIAEERQAISGLPPLGDAAGPARRALLLPLPPPRANAAACPLRSARRSASACALTGPSDGRESGQSRRRAARARHAACQANAMSPGRQAQAAKMRAYWAARRAEQQAGGRKTAGRKAGRKK